MKNTLKKIFRLTKLSLLILLALTTLFSCQPKKLASRNNDFSTSVASTKVANKAKQSSLATNSINNEQNSKDSNTNIDENGTYTSKDEVALYIYTYHKLPQNYITKNEAKKLGWNSSKNYVGDVAKGKSIGGDRFNNYQKILPDIKGRKYIECDIDYKGKKRNAKRIVYADDFDESIGFIYYTDDHYNTFEKLY